MAHPEVSQAQVEPGCLVLWLLLQDAKIDLSGFSILGDSEAPVAIDDAARLACGG
jgi:hypothetical protein